MADVDQNQSTDVSLDVKEIEAELFDQWVLAKRAGQPVNIDELISRLPEARRSEFGRLLTTTDVLQELTGNLRAALAETAQADPSQPVVVVVGTK